MTDQPDLFSSKPLAKSSTRSELDRLQPRRVVKIETLMALCKAARERAALAETDRTRPVGLSEASMLTEQMLKAAVNAAAIVNRDVNLSLALWAEQQANRLKQSPHDERLSREGLTADEVAEALYETRRPPSARPFADLDDETAAVLTAAAEDLMVLVVAAAEGRPVGVLDGVA